MNKFTHENRPDFTALSDERRIELLNSLYDSELKLTQICADLKSKLSVADLLVNKLITRYESAGDDIDRYMNAMCRIDREIRNRNQLRLPLDN